MDDTYQINVAKTKFREAYSRGDVEQLLSVFDEEGFTDMSEGGPNAYDAAANEGLRERSAKLFADQRFRHDVHRDRPGVVLAAARPLGHPHSDAHCWHTRQFGSDSLLHGLFCRQKHPSSTASATPDTRLPRKRELLGSQLIPYSLIRSDLDEGSAFRRCDS
ncbi:MAG: hypothetical protein WB460_20255 [Candidatus Acidiferrales bacterium]